MLSAGVSSPALVSCKSVQLASPLEGDSRNMPSSFHHKYSGGVSLVTYLGSRLRRQTWTAGPAERVR